MARRRLSDQQKARIAKIQQRRRQRAETQAEAELAWYTTEPTVPLCYATGCALIKAVREYEQQRDGFELKTFHDALLRQIPIALRSVLMPAFGDDAWIYARARVFQPG